MIGLPVMKRILMRIRSRIRRIRTRLQLEANLAKLGIRRRLNVETPLETPPSGVGPTGSGDDQFFEQGREFAGHLGRLGA